MKTKNTPPRHSRTIGIATPSNPKGNNQISSRPQSLFSRLGSFTSHLGFTLVELIVVITILAILGTIAFVSLQGFAGSARDSVRVSDLANLTQALELTQLKTGSYPTPTNGFAVTFSGGTVWTQGTIGDSVLTVLNSAGFKLSKKPTDPKYPNIEYVYSLLNTGKEYQIGTIAEDNNTAYGPLISTVYAAETFVAYIRGNYNGLIAKVQVGTTTYYLSLPSIILQNLSALELSVPATQSGNLVLHKKGNLPHTYTADNIISTIPSVTFDALNTSNQITDGSGILAYSATGSLDSAGIAILMNNLYNLYNTSNLKGDATSASKVSSFLSGGTGSTTLTDFYNGVVSKSIGGSVVSATTPSPTVTNATCGQNATTYASGSITFLGDFANDFCTTSNSTLSGGINPFFPVAGSGVSWICNSTSSGGSPANCTATRVATTPIPDLADFEAEGGYSVTDGSWIRTDTDAYEGTYSLLSGNHEDSSVSCFEITKNLLNPSVLSFYYKVSSEEWSDFLNFYADGVHWADNSWSGEVPWSSYSGVYNTGSHIFKWCYEKDDWYGGEYTGPDSAWVDAISFDSNNAICGSSNGASLVSEPTSDLCTTGIAGTVSGSGPWVWDCMGINGGATVNCSASKLTVNGTCGWADNTKYRVNVPTASYLCSAGVPTVVSGSGPWTWTCQGQNEGTDSPTCTTNRLLPPTEQVATVAQTNITWNWTNPTGVNNIKWSDGTGYWWDKSTATSHSETSLTCNSTYPNRAVKACDDTGACATTTLSSASTTACMGIYTVGQTFTYNGATVTVTGTGVGTSNTTYGDCPSVDIAVWTNGGSGPQIWSRCNVGATLVFTGYVANGTDNPVATTTTAGKYFQMGEDVAWTYTAGVASGNNCTWNRDTQLCGASALSAWSTIVSDTGVGSSDRWYDWGGTTIPNTRGPCASGYHVPTRIEWNNATTILGTRNTFASTLKLPMAGERYYDPAGVPINQGTGGYYWSSTPGSYQGFDFTTKWIFNHFPELGFSVRCIRN